MKKKPPSLICSGYYLQVLYLCQYFKKFLEVTKLQCFLNVELNNLTKYNKVACMDVLVRL